MRAWDTNPRPSCRHLFPATTTFTRSGQLDGSLAGSSPGRTRRGRSSFLNRFQRRSPDANNLFDDRPELEFNALVRHVLVEDAALGKHAITETIRGPKRIRPIRS